MDTKYHKINSIFKRELKGDHHLIEGDWAQPEFAYLASNQWDFTEKVDGTNIRVMYNYGSVTFGGRTDQAHIPAQLVAKLNLRFMIGPYGTLEAVFPGGSNIVLYGEGFGAKIQKRGENYQSYQDFVLYDVRVGDWWLSRNDVEDIAKRLNLPVVPVIGTGTLYDAIDLVKSGFKSRWGDFEAEGIVARPTVELANRAGNRIITKIKCRDFAAQL